MHLSFLGFNDANESHWKFVKHLKSQNWCSPTLRLWSMKLLVEMLNFQKVKLLEYDECWRSISKWKETKIGLRKYLRRKARHDRRSHMPNQHCLSLKINARNWEVTPPTSSGQHIFLPILTAYHIKHDIVTSCPFLTPYLLANFTSQCSIDSYRYSLQVALFCRLLCWRLLGVCWMMLKADIKFCLLWTFSSFSVIKLCSYVDPEAAVGCEDGTVRLFDMYSRKCSRIIKYVRREITVSHICFIHFIGYL